MAALVVDYETLATVRKARILSRAVRIDVAGLSPDLAQKVQTFLLTIGGTWVDDKQHWAFKKHPLAAIGAAIVNDVIICQS